MFRRLIQIFRGDAPNPGSRPVQVVLASGKQEDGGALETIVEGTQWSLTSVPDFASAAGALRRLAAPILLCDRDLPGVRWQDALRTFAAGSGGPCVILLSSVADQYLWDDVIERGGFDVLTRPFQKQQVLAMFDFALTHWRTTQRNGAALRTG